MGLRGGVWRQLPTSLSHSIALAPGLDHSATDKGGLGGSGRVERGPRNLSESASETQNDKTGLCIMSGLWADGQFCGLRVFWALDRPQKCRPKFTALVLHKKPSQNVCLLVFLYFLSILYGLQTVYYERLRKLLWARFWKPRQLFVRYFSCMFFYYERPARNGPGN